MSWWTIILLVIAGVFLITLYSAKRPTKEEYIQAEKDKVHQAKEVKKWKERQKEREKERDK